MKIQSEGILRLLNAFARNRAGNFAILSIMTFIPIIYVVGSAIDLSTARRNAVALQSAMDSAVLATAAQYNSAMVTKDLRNMVIRYLSANNQNAAKLAADPSISADQQLCATSTKPVATKFMSIAGVNSLNVSATACATLAASATLEISLVLDVSSSMIEQSRFTPMIQAVQDFITAFAKSTKLSGKTRIAIVPFSSRVNIGYNNANTSWLKSYGGQAAVPDRWINPDSYYSSSSYTKAYWIDNVTVDEYTSKNYYWMGCIEPRSDVEVMEKGSVGTYGLSDAPPSVSKFVAMDTNPGSSKSFCPPPIVPLTNNFTLLRSAMSNMTSEGSTRLDAGMVAGWYTLSPNWQSTWPSTALPASYSSSVRKIVVFMTDGMMNTQSGTSSGKLDWRCQNMQSTTSNDACDAAATNDLLSICATMKSRNIEIYTVGYSSDADTTNIRSCATSPDHFFQADPSSAKSNYIGSIYGTIASAISNGGTRLTR